MPTINGGGRNRRGVGGRGFEPLCRCRTWTWSRCRTARPRAVPSSLRTAFPANSSPSAAAVQQLRPDRADVLLQLGSQAFSHRLAGDIGGARTHRSRSRRARRRSPRRRPRCRPPSSPGTRRPSGPGWCRSRYPCRPRRSSGCRSPRRSSLMVAEPTSTPEMPEPCMAMATPDGAHLSVAHVAHGVFLRPSRTAPCSAAMQRSSAQAVSPARRSRRA